MKDNYSCAKNRLRQKGGTFGQPLLYLYMRYGVSPPDLLDMCDVCGAKFSIAHALSYKKGGLVSFTHNKIRDELISIAQVAFQPSAVCTNPRLTSSMAQEPETLRTTEEICLSEASGREALIALWM